jgi:hypothetical protein
MDDRRQNRKFSFPVTSLAGSSLPNFLKVIGAHRIYPRYYGRFTLSMLASAILEPFRFYETLACGKKIAEVDLKPPVFIIGFWRTGTTLLHNLLCQDPRAAYVTTFHTVFPHQVLTQYWWLKGLVNHVLPARRPFDNVSMDMDFPQEEEIALANMQTLSFYKFWYFPADFDSYYNSDLYLDAIGEKKLKEWKAAYFNLIRKAHLNTGGSRFISKNPSNLGRIKYLLETFPDARFIFTFRNPYKAIESFYRFSHEVLPATQLQSITGKRSAEIYTRLFSDLLNRYEKEKNLIPEGNLLEIKFEEFEQDKLYHLGRVYQQFGMEGFEEAIPYFREYLQEVKDFHKTAYEVSPEIITLVNKYLGKQVTSWGYEKVS